ncbi:MAG: histidine kinase [Rhodothermaceae bacterium]|nr:histidine kinase [Rhodothermaceae bacterium]
MNKPKNRPYFRLGFRIASATSLVVTGIVLFVTLLHVPYPLSVLIPAIAGVASFMSAYFITVRLLDDRFNRVMLALKGLQQKLFDDERELEPIPKDELDDIYSELLKASVTIEREIQRLTRIESYRKEFIGDISHELKTPIFAIQGFIETLMDGALEDETVNREFLRKAMRNVNRLMVLIRNLMDISRLETGDMKPEIQAFVLHDVILEVIESLQIKAGQEKVSLHLHNIDKYLKVNADRNQIRQVFINLTENAIKYNRPGGSVHIGLKPFTRSDPRITVYIRDTGIGIEGRDLNRVTERFFRVDKSRSREKGGTGLGLAIVKHILESHDEILTIESKPREGSTFSFTLSNAERVLG